MQSVYSMKFYVCGWALGLLSAIGLCVLTVWASIRDPDMKEHAALESMLLSLPESVSRRCLTVVAKFRY